MSALGSRKPGNQNALCLLGELTKIQRSPVEEDNDDIGIDLSDGAEQIHLDVRKIEEGTAGGLSGLQEMLAEGHDDKVSILRCLDGSGLHFCKLFRRIGGNVRLGKTG